MSRKGRREAYLVAAGKEHVDQRVTDYVHNLGSKNQVIQECHAFFKLGFFILVSRS